MMTLEEASALSGRSPSTLRRAAIRGTLKAEKLGRDWLVSPAALDAYVRSADATARGKRLEADSHDNAL